ncbi:hypothetical protein CTA1_9672 [Colletotrichum tanaceti]|uniref:Uncharacterized protein n=1 Tax=Colletotrichum tanaceti TaxID=1306861 RepID=A0A4U6XDM8_9PEZI|nr:hypothetical protein CTA1_9672 [Colletotrichum tanaceti]
MRFATEGESLFGQPEVGGGQFHPGLISRARAMDYVLSSKGHHGRRRRSGWLDQPRLRHVGRDGTASLTS